MAAFFQATARVSGAGVSNCCAMARRQFTTSVTRSSRSYGGWLPHHVAIGLKCFHGETLCAWPWRSLRSSKTRLGRHGDGFRSRLRLGGCSGSQIDGVAIGRRRRGQQKTRKTAPFPVALRRFDSAFGPRFDAACPPPARRSPSPKCAPVAFGSLVVPPARVRSSAPPKSTRRSGLPIADDRGHPWAMSTKSRESIYGCSIRSSAERAKEARKEADRLGCEAWNQRMLGYKGPAQQPSPALGDALNAGYRFLEVRCLARSAAVTTRTHGKRYQPRGVAPDTVHPPAHRPGVLWKAKR
jgi:hypothetical protein